MHILDILCTVYLYDMYIYPPIMYIVHMYVLQISEMYSSGGELHIELMTGQPQGSKSLWVSGSAHCISITHVTHYSDTYNVMYVHRNATVYVYIDFVHHE